MSLFCLRSVFVGASLLSAPVLAISAKSESVSCLEPFAGTRDSFLLQESLPCDHATDAMNLVIINASTPGYFAPDAASFFLQTECIGHDKVLNLHHNASAPYVVDWSDAVPNQPGVFRINKTCKQETIALLDTRPQPRKGSADESMVNFQVTSNTTDGKVTAYVLASEDTGTSLRIRSTIGGSLLANAAKTFHNGSPCYANWMVETTGDLDPIVISYILSWKDNRKLDCNPQQPPSDASMSGSSWALVGGGALALAGIGSVIVAFTIHKRRVAQQTVIAAHNLVLYDAIEAQDSEQHTE